MRLAPAFWGCGIGAEATLAVVDWVTTDLPAYPLVARVRPENVASQRIAVQAGLVRTPDLDTEGEDGLDWIYVRNWTVDS